MTLPVAGLIVLVAVLALERRFFAESGARAPHLGRPAWPAPDPPDPTRHAILVNGGWRPRKNHTRYWNNLSLLHRTLRLRGWESVTVLSAGGPSGGPDRVVRSWLGTFAVGPLAGSSPDLDDDGRPDVAGPATAESFRRTIVETGARMKGGDSLLLVLTDHGQFRLAGGRARAVAMLWGGEMTGRDLDSWLREAIPPAAQVTIVAAQCHSYWFLREITRPRTTCIASGRPLWIWSGPHYSIFLYRLCEALLGEDPVSGVPLPVTPGAGRPTTGEAFRVATRRDHAPEWPTMWDVGAQPGVTAPAGNQSPPAAGF